MSGLGPVRLPVLEWGERGRGRVLLVHGLGSSAQVWWRIADRLARRGWIVSAPDLRGHGAAPRTERYPLAAYAADLVAVGSGWDVVVGHSLGGSASLLASVPRGWSRRLVLLDPVLRIDEADHDRVAAELAAEVDLGAEELRAANPGWHPEDIHLKVDAIRRTSRHVITQTMADSRPWDVTAALGAVTVPTEVLVVPAGRGGLADPDLVAGISGRNPWVAHRLLDDCGHSIQRDQPEAVVEAVGSPPG